MTSTHTGYNASALDRFANQLAGQIYPPDVQCEEDIGSGSYLCRVSPLTPDTVFYYLQGRSQIPYHVEAHQKKIFGELRDI